MLRSTIAPLLAVMACSSSSPPPAGPAPAPPSGDDARCTDPRPSATHVCVRDCGPPVARPGEPEPPWRWLSADELARREQFGCPRCLPAATRIATPAGDRAVADLAVGDPIWTRDRAGRRAAATVVYAGSSVVVGGHVLVRLTLADGRVVAASPAHPDADGRAVADLAPGAALSGSTVVAVAYVPLDGTRTYDVLPSGETGTYWADGVVLRSTFAPAAPPR